MPQLSVVREDREVIGSPQGTQRTEVPLVQGHDPGRPVSVREDDIRGIRYPDVIARTRGPIHHRERGGMISRAPFRELVRLVRDIAGEPARRSIS